MRTPPHIDEFPVKTDDLARPVHHQDPVGGGFEGRAEQGEGPFEFLLRPSLFRHVGSSADPAVDFPARVPKGLTVLSKIPPRPGHIVMARLPRKGSMMG